MPERASCAAVILGNDALVAARPCSPWQLAHACRAAGFDIVVPPTLGDELVAGAYLERLAGDEIPIVVACHCPRARAALARQRPHPHVSMIRLVAPPVAAARALRLTYGAGMLVTYVGDCPVSDDPSINARFTPSGFLGSLERQGISVAGQPDAMPASDGERWSRYRSVPGGLPALRWLARAPVDRVVRDVEASQIDPARWVGSRSKVLIDVGERSGCACGGQRARIEECEPLRASAASVETPVGLDLRDDPPAAAVVPGRHAGDGSRPTDGSGGLTKGPDERAATSPPAPGPPRQERQRRISHAMEAGGGLAVASGRPAAPATPSPGAVAVSDSVTSRRALTLLLIPLAVLVATASLGAGVYALASRQAPVAPVSGEWPSSRGDTELRRPDTTPGSEAKTPNAGSDAAAAGTTGVPLLTTPSGSAGHGGAIATPATSPDSTAALPRSTPKQGRRRPRIEVVPGWLPQSGQTATPIDTIRRPRRDSSAAVPPDTIPRT